MNDKREYESTFVNLVYLIVDFLQEHLTITSYIKKLIKKGKNDFFGIFLELWAMFWFVLVLILNFFDIKWLMVMIFAYRIWEILLTNFYLFIFKQGATKKVNSNEENEIRLLLLLMIQYFSIILCFSGIYKYLEIGFKIYEGVLINGITWIYYSITTITTVGYGDIHPITFYTMLISIIESLSGMFFILLFVNTVLSKFRFIWKEKNKKDISKL